MLRTHISKERLILRLICNLKVSEGNNIYLIKIVRKYLDYYKLRVKDNVCPVCKKQFKSFRGLVAHISQVHADEISKIYNDVMNIFKLINTLIIKKDPRHPYLCIICKKKFNRYCEIFEHVINEHIFNSLYI